MTDVSAEDAKKVRRRMQSAWTAFLQSDAYLNGSLDTTKASTALGQAEASARRLGTGTTPEQFIGAVDSAIRELDAVSSITPQEQTSEIEGVVSLCVEARNTASSYVDEE